MSLAGTSAGGAVGGFLELAFRIHGAFATYCMIGALLGFMAGIPNGLIIWAETPGTAHKASTPLESWRQDRALLHLRVITWAFAGIVAGGLVGWLLEGNVGGLIQGIPVGAAFAVIGIFSGRHHASLVYSICVWRLSRAEQLPRRLMAFLDDVHRLGLLRAVGPIYQFRHADIQDQLGRLSASPFSSTTSTDADKNVSW